MVPAKVEPFFCRKDWGGDRLCTLFGKNIPDRHTGESWEISAHENGECRVYGMKLSQAVTRYGKELLGEAGTPFPLLIKLLDARENLSVQVHPDDELALELEGVPYGKTEAWVVLDAPQGAELIMGITCAPEEYLEAVRAGDVESKLKRVPVKAGDAIFIPAGTVHALMAGVVVYEVQQSSDTTYRLYAWGRDAELHLEKSARAMALPAAGAGLCAPRPISPGIERLVACEAFTLDRISAQVPVTLRPDGTKFACLTALGSGVLTHGGGEIQYGKGESILVPASCGTYTLSGGTLLLAEPVVT